MVIVAVGASLMEQAKIQFVSLRRHYKRNAICIINTSLR